MNPNDLADAFGDTSSDTVIRRSIVSNDGHRILVVGTIPEQGVPSIGIHVDAVRIDGSMDTMVALEMALEDVLLDMDDTICGDWQPVHCWCGEEHPMVESKGTPGYRRPEYRVKCPMCGLRTAWYKSRTDALVSWQEDDTEEIPLTPCPHCGKAPQVLWDDATGMWKAGCGCPVMRVVGPDEACARYTWNALVEKTTIEKGVGGTE